MTAAPQQGERTPGHNVLLYPLCVLLFASGAMFLVVCAVLELSWKGQAIAASGLVLLALCLGASRARPMTLTLILLSCFATFRYCFWRFVTVARFFSGPPTRWKIADEILICLLLAAECFAFVRLFLGYLQSIAPLQRQPAALPEDITLWPQVDLLIPTFNEPLSVVKTTALAALHIDWPSDRLGIYILDDGRREEFRVFAEEAGVGYMTRPYNRDAKAGNINRALERLNAPFVTVFDADCVPVRSFLQLTMGWFDRDGRLGMLQTPQGSRSPDPYQRNLRLPSEMPSEDELFYRVVQDGNDLWNATLFCGSAAVLRRSALDDVGGFAVETVTEDVHTSLRMAARGWNTACLNIPQSAGLAPARLGAYVRQRVRWASGMVSILRLDNPLFMRGLGAAQRLCYLNAMLHFLSALPRLIFLLAPLAYLVFGRTALPGYWAAILAYALPHLLLASVANGRLRGAYRQSFWGDVYETVLAPHLLIPGLRALLQPGSGEFRVTDKSAQVPRSSFDGRTARPFLVLLLLNLLGLLCAVPRAFPIHLGSRFHFAATMLSRMYDPAHRGAVLLNVLWAVFNLLLLGVAISAACERRQRRRTVRSAAAVPIRVSFAGGDLIAGTAIDFSTGGLSLQTERRFSARAGDPIGIAFPSHSAVASLPATVLSVDGIILRAAFGSLSIAQDKLLVTLLYSRADRWLRPAPDRNRRLRNLARLLRAAFGWTRRSAEGDEAPTGPATEAGEAASSLLLLTIPWQAFLAKARALAAFETAQLVRAVRPALSHLFAGTHPLPFWIATGLVLSRAPWLLALVAVLSCLAMALPLHFALSRKARRRLKTS